MKHNLLLSALLISGTVALLGTGCYSITDPGSLELKTSLSWENELPDIDPIEGERRIVYLNYKDASGGDLPNLRDDIRKSLEDCGYVVTRNVREAWFTIDIKVTYFGEERNETTGSASVGAIAGGVGGAIAGNVVGGNTAGTVIGAGALGGIGAIAGGLLDRHNPIRTYNLILEVSCGERIPEGYTESMLGGGIASNTSGFNRRGSLTSQTAYENRSSDLKLKREFYKQKNVLTVSVTKRNLVAEEAYDAAIGRLSRAFGGIMPDTDPDIDPITPAEYLERLQNTEN